MRSYYDFGYKTQHAIGKVNKILKTQDVDDKTRELLAQVFELVFEDGKLRASADRLISELETYEESIRYTVK
jgi:hypothetical protein